MLTNGVWSFTWDAENRLVSACSNNVLLVRNTYDPRSRRIRKEVSAYNASTGNYEPVTCNAFLWDGWNVFREVRDQMSEVSTNYYTWGSDLSGSLQGAGGVGGLLAVTTVSAADPQPVIHFPMYDANGNITEYVATNGMVVARYEYDAFGATVAQFGPLAETFTHRFSTKPFDVETGLVMYQLRPCEPNLGRWLSRDPIGVKGGINIYGIAGNDLMNKWDYLGMFPHLTDEDIQNHFLKLRSSLKKKLKSKCPESPMSWKCGAAKKDCCCKPKDCNNEAEKLAEAYIKALEHAFRLRKYPGGKVGNICIMIDDGWGAGQFCSEVESGGLTCGGWSEMGEVVLSPITEKSDCWVYNTEKSKFKIRWKGVDYPAHQWSSLKVMNGKKVHLDPWKSGGWWY